MFPQVNVEGCGIYDNIGHGVQTEGDTTIMNTDILCNQRHAVSAEGTANVQVRVYSHSHIPLKSPFFLPVKNGLDKFPKWCSHMMSKYVDKIKGSADKNGDFDGFCEQGLRIFIVNHSEVKILIQVVKIF